MLLWPTLAPIAAVILEEDGVFRGLTPQCNTPDAGKSEISNGKKLMYMYWEANCRMCNCVQSAHGYTSGEEAVEL